MGQTQLAWSNGVLPQLGHSFGQRNAQPRASSSVCAVWLCAPKCPTCRTVLLITNPVARSFTEPQLNALELFNQTQLIRSRHVRQMGQQCVQFPLAVFRYALGSHSVVRYPPPPPLPISRAPGTCAHSERRQAAHPAKRIFLRGYCLRRANTWPVLEMMSLVSSVSLL